MQHNKEELFKSLAQQLRYPAGNLGKEVAEKMNKGNRLMNLETIKELHVSENDCVLEIGMGNGFFVKDILSSNNTIEYYGCDTSPEMVDQAIELNSGWVKNGRASFVVGDAHKLPYPNQHFNKIFTVNTIYFWEDAPKVFDEFKRTLKKDGTLIITIRPKAVMEKMPVSKYGFRLFSREDAIRVLSENGFKTINVVEKVDEDVKFQDLVIKNAFIVISAVLT